MSGIIACIKNTIVDILECLLSPLGVNKKEANAYK